MKKLLFVLGLCLLPWQPLAAQKLSAMRFPGTGFSIQLPDSFVAAERFAGFQDRSGAVSVMTSHMASELERNLQALDSAKLKNIGAQLMSREVIKAPGGDRYLLSMRQQLKQQPYVKQMLLIGDSSGTRIFSSFVPEKDTVMGHVMLTALRNLSYDATFVINPWDGLSFTLDLQGADLSFVSTNAGGVIFSNDGRYPPRSAKHTALVTGLATKGFSPHSRREITENRLKSLKLADSLKVASSDSVTIDQLQGYELVAYGSNTKGEKVLVYLLLLFETNERYYMVSAHTNHAYEEQLQLFRKMARTFLRKK